MNTQTKHYDFISADAGKKLTFFKEGDDIKTFDFFSSVCIPEGKDVSNLREITEDEAAELLQQKEDAIANDVL